MGDAWRPRPGALRRARTGRHPFTQSGRALGLLYVGGALFGLVAIGIPHGSHFDLVADLALSSLALTIGGWAWSRRELGPAPTHALLTLGMAMVSAGVYSGRGDDVSMSAAVLYVVLALGAGLFVSPRGVVAQVVVMGTAYGVVLGLSGNRAAFAEWLFVIGAVAVTAWVTSMSRSELVRLAQLDPLTGLANRSGLRGALEHELARSRRSGRTLSVAVVDLDGFKTLNDEHGHLAGDQALVRLVQTWRSGLRGGDLLARFGGDEFVIMFPETSMWEATQVLHRLHRHEVACAWSAGLAAWDGTEKAAQLLQRADAALYRAKGRRHSWLALARSTAIPLARTGTV
jgi:diguanylate cyclase (GGDEF)-like protein